MRQGRPYDASGRITPDSASSMKRIQSKMIRSERADGHNYHHGRSVTHHTDLLGFLTTATPSSARRPYSRPHPSQSAPSPRPAPSRPAPSPRLARTSPGPGLGYRYQGWPRPLYRLAGVYSPSCEPSTTQEEARSKNTKLAKVGKWRGREMEG